MTDKENDEFSSAVLLVAIAVYVAVTAALFAGMVAMSPDVGAALAGWAKDYGSIIAGVPVLIAVWVAKQQLDANRRQHVATIKYNLRRELDALNRLEAFAKFLLRIESRSIDNPNDMRGLAALRARRPKENDLKQWVEILPEEVSSYAIEAWLRCGELIELIRSMDTKLSLITTKIDTSQMYAEILLKNISVHRSHLAEFWS